MAIIGRFGQLSDTVGLKTVSGSQINPAREDGNLLATVQNLEEIQDILAYVRIIASELEAIKTVDSAQRLRVSVDAAPAQLAGVTTVGTVATCSTVTNMTGLANVDARFLFMETARNSYSNGIRSKLT